MADHPQLNWQAEALWLQLEPLLPGLTVEVVAEIGSTNTELLARARHDDQPALLVAEHQNAGRGRQGKAWQSRPGASLTFSLALPLALADWSGLSLAIGLAVAEALDPAADGHRPQLMLKWPNDLMLRDDAAPGGGRKLGGILIETLPLPAASTAPGRPPRRMAVIGIGLNLQPLDDAGPAVEPPPWGRASLAELLPGQGAPAVLARIAEPLVRTLQRFAQQGFAPLQPAYAARDLLHGLALRTTLADLPEGVADGVDDTGTLWLRVEGGEQGSMRRPVASGELSLRPTVAPRSAPAPAPR